MSSEVVVLYVIVAVETTLLFAIFLVLRAVIWPMYVKTRDHCTLLEERLNAISAGRDGWREVAERALFVAREGKGVTQRATKIATNGTNVT